MTFSQLGLQYEAVHINGIPGVICLRQGQLFSVIAFTIAADKITEMNILADPDRLRRLDLSTFGENQY